MRIGTFLTWEVLHVTCIKWSNNAKKFNEEKNKTMLCGLIVGNDLGNWDILDRSWGTAEGWTRLLSVAFQACRDGRPALCEAAPCSQGTIGNRAPKWESSSWIRIRQFTPVPALHQSNHPLPSQHRKCDILRERTLAHRATRRLGQVKHIIFSRETQVNSESVLNS
jgi:hypothetical protein